MGSIETTDLQARVAALPSVAYLRAKLGAGGEPLYLVGGAVRDLLLGRSPLDLDLAVEGPVDDLAARLGGTVECYERFSTATVALDGVRVDIAQTRAESYSAPGALPDVRPAAITEDLRRRDFTVNAMAVALTGPGAGEFLSVDGALGDLEAGRLAVLHERSFVDDPTRLWRLARYQARLRFEVAPTTRALAAAAVRDGALETVSGPRIGSELRIALTEPDPIATLQAAAALGLGWGLDGELAQRALEALPAAGRRDLLLVAVARLDEPAEETRALLDLLEFPSADRDVVLDAATRARVIGERARVAKTGSDIARAIGNAGVETTALARALVPSEQLQRWQDDLSQRTLQITGDDLIASGLNQGPPLGQALAAAREAMWNDEAPDREAQLAVALAAADRPLR